MAAPRTCPFCREALMDCVCPEDAPGILAGDPGEPDPEPYPVNEHAEGM